MADFTIFSAVPAILSVMTCRVHARTVFFFLLPVHRSLERVRIGRMRATGYITTIRYFFFSSSRFSPFRSLQSRPSPPRVPPPATRDRGNLDLGSRGERVFFFCFSRPAAILLLPTSSRGPPDNTTAPDGARALDTGSDQREDLRRPSGAADGRFLVSRRCTVRSFAVTPPVAHAITIVQRSCVEELSLGFFFSIENHGSADRAAHVVRALRPRLINK